MQSNVNKVLVQGNINKGPASKNFFPVVVESSSFTDWFKRSERTQLMLLITWKGMVASQIDKLEEAKNTPVKCCGLC